MSPASRPLVAPLQLAAGLLVLSACASSSTGPKAEHFTHPSGERISALALPGRPHGVAVARNGTFYISQIDAAEATRGTLEADGQRFTGSVEVGLYPAHIALNPAGTTAYTADQYSNSVTVIDVATDKVTTTIPLTDGGFNLLVSPDGGRVYATTASGRLHVIDAATNQVLMSLPVGPAANGLAFAEKTNTLYVSTRDGARVTAIDAKSNTAVRSYPVSGGAQRIAVTRDASTLYIASESAGLEILDLATGERRTVPGVLQGAVGLALSPDEAQLYVANPPAGLVQVVDRASSTIVRMLTVASSPRNVAFDRSGSTAVITDEGGQVIFVR
jgi:YVTN family beta-propeller protein